MTARLSSGGDGRGSLAFYAVMRALVVGFFRIWSRLSVEGAEHVPTSGPFVLAPVHRSNVDTPILGAVTTRRMRFMGKDSLWRHPATAWLFSALGGFPVVRGTADREAMRRCIEVLEGGEPLVLFPEGTRQSGPLVQPLFDGAAYVACRSRVPIVPVGIGGSEGVMPKGARSIHPRKVHLVIGAPLHPPVDAAGRVPRRAVKELTDTLAVELQRLFDAAQARAGA